MDGEGLIDSRGFPRRLGNAPIRRSAYLRYARRVRVRPVFSMASDPAHLSLSDRSRDEASTAPPLPGCHTARSPVNPARFYSSSSNDHCLLRSYAVLVLAQPPNRILRMKHSVGERRLSDEEESCKSIRTWRNS